MHRLFLDANILFSAAYRAQSGLLGLWSLPGVKLLSSPYAIEEARRNLREAAQQARLATLTARLEVVESMGPEIEADLPEKDKPIPRSAIAGRATHLITGDMRHFGKFFGKRLAGIIVLTPRAYLVLNC